LIIRDTKDNCTISFMASCMGAVLQFLSLDEATDIILS